MYEIEYVIFDFKGVLYDSENEDLDLDILDLVKDLYESGYKMYIFSNSSRKTVDYMDRKHQYLQYFENVILSEELGYSKPSQEAFESLFEVVSDYPEKMLLIDDRGQNLDMGRRCGMKALLYTNIEELKSNLYDLIQYDEQG